jgi:hypothetical protein
MEKRKIKQVVRLLKIKQLTLKELQISREELRELRDMNYRIRHQDSDRGRVYYMITEAENNSLFISGASREEQIIKWVELSDLHAGSKQFDEVGFKEIMNRAIDYGFVDFHISGDLCDGYLVYNGHLNNLRYWQAEDQAEYLAEILLQYPKARYIACTGNHDFSFVKHGSVNPISIVQDILRGEGREFTFLDSFAADLVIAGVLKRMIHLDGMRTYAKSYPGQTYIRNLLDSHGEHAYVQGNKYRIRFIQMGHYHSEIAFETAGIQCTHPGNFQFPNDYTIRRGLVGPQGTRFTTVIIRNRIVLDYTSTFVKPRR